MAASIDAVVGRLAKDEKQHVKELQEFIRIPSVSADPAYAKDVRKAADWMAKRLRKAGLENVESIPTRGHPVVVADWLHAKDAPTVLVYGHYDVQPARKEDGWSRDPWDPHVDGKRIWGRGSTDDKGQLLCHVDGAEAWLKEAGSLPVNLRMVFEGEEESGSLHFPEVLEKHRGRLEADVLLVSDSMMLAEGRPAINTSMRGLTYLQVDVQGPKGDLHSGTWGGVVWNPIEALCHMLASCKDARTGRILLRGFYADVQKPTRAQRATLATHGTPDQVLRDGTGVDDLFGEAGWSGQERIGLRPTFEVNGIWGGYSGAGSKTVIPATAHAKLSCRLVPDQDPDAIAQLVEKHLLRHAPRGVRVEVTRIDDGHPISAEIDDPYLQAVSRALEDTFGAPAVMIPEGGTIPAVADMQRLLGVVPVMAGFGNRDENMHAPDESFRMGSFLRGREAAARMLLEIASVTT